MKLAADSDTAVASCHVRLLGVDISLDLIPPVVTTDLLEQLNDWTVALDNRDSVTVGYIDYAKAFDSVSPQKLCYKLQA